MEFCPKCGGLFLPQKVGRSIGLICQLCGYKGELKEQKAYKISEKGSGAREVIVIEEKEGKKRPRREYEPEPIEYYEELYE